MTQEPGDRMSYATLLQELEHERAERRRLAADAAEQRRGLEERLRERTKELVKTNKDLLRLAETLQARVDARTAELEKARDEAVQGDETKAAFLAMMSHEIRTPLHAIMGMTELVLETDLTGEQRTLLQRVIVNSETLLHILDETLDLSRIQSGNIELVTAPLSLREVIEDAAEFLCIRAEERKLELVVDIAPDVPAQLQGDSQRIRQILINLINNAIKFTDDGEVRVEAIVAPEQERTFVRIRVTDSGIGIAPEELDRIFERFVRVESDSQRRGTGLGLAIARSFAEMMGGDITVTSELGVGSTFEVTLDLLNGEEPEEAHAERPLADMRIELVTKNDAVRAAVARLLDSAGALVTPFKTLESIGDAKAAGARRPDVRVIDEGLLTDDQDLSGDRLVLLTSLTSLTTHSETTHRLVARPVRREPLITAVLRASDPHRSRSVRASRLPEVDDGRDRVLLVEDDRDVAQLMIRLLEREGCIVDHAGEGRTALERLLRRSYGLILSDVHMPVIGGVELVKRLRAIEVERDMPKNTVVAVTAYTIGSATEEYLAAGFDEVVSKPVRAETLRQLLDRHLERRTTVAVVDDSPDARRLMDRMLSRAGYRVLLFESGEDAITGLADERAALVLLDMDMPGIDGLTTAVRLREHHPTIRMLALTGRSGPTFEQQVARAGFNGHLLKPTPRVKLLDAIEETLDAPSEPPPAAHTSSLRGEPVSVDSDIEDLVPDFFRNRWVAHREMLEAMERGDVEVVRRHAHRMRGVGGAYGFNELTELGATMEEHAIAGRLQELAEVLKEVELHLERMSVRLHNGDVIRACLYRGPR